MTSVFNAIHCDIISTSE